MFLQQFHAVNRFAMLQAREAGPANDLREAVLAPHFFDLPDAIFGITTDHSALLK